MLTKLVFVTITTMEEKIREVLEDFLEIYKSEPCLWMIQSKQYHDRDMKHAAYQKLIEKLKEIDPDADRTKVIKKINSLRTNFRKEMKKVNASRTSGAGVSDVYIPKLWYFEIMRFIDDQAQVRESLTNISDSDNETQTSTTPQNTGDDDSLNNNTQLDNIIMDGEAAPENTAELTQSNSEISTRSSRVQTIQNIVSRTASRPGKKSKTDIANEVLHTVNEHFKRPREQKNEDRFDVFGKTVAIKLRGADKVQMLLAEKIINEVLFEAEMGTLTRSHQLTSTTTDRSFNPIIYTAQPSTDIHHGSSAGINQNERDRNSYTYNSAASFISGYTPHL